jgi:hypothetical protein
LKVFALFCSLVWKCHGFQNCAWNILPYSSSLWDLLDFVTLLHFVEAPRCEVVCKQGKKSPEPSLTLRFALRDGMQPPSSRILFSMHLRESSRVICSLKLWSW